MRYPIIYADPPWSYDNDQSGQSARGGTAYPRMALDGLKALPVGRLADDDCTLFLWATHPKMREALEVIEAWGFRYVTCAFMWVKTNRSGEGFYSGLGYWTNGNTEPCLLAVKGHPRWMRAARDVKQLVVTPVGRHSAKPDEVRDRIVRLMGDRSRVELFARGTGEGWDSWGSDAERPIIWLDAAFRGFPGSTEVPFGVFGEVEAAAA